MNTQERRPETDDEGSPGGGDAPGALSPKQELALQAVLSHPTLKEEAAAGVSDATLWRYMRDKEFSRRLREARRGAVDHAVSRLQSSTGDAVTVLRELMTSEGVAPHARIATARAVLEYLIRTGEVDELRARIEEFEEFVKERQREGAL